MLVGVPKEIKNHEYRVGMTPGSVRELVRHGHAVIVQKNAGSAIGLSDEQYAAAGAELADGAEEVFARAQLIVKVKEPQPDECLRLRPEQTLFTYLHLAPDPRQTDLLLASGVTAIAYETVTDRFGGLPLLTPMSEVAGRMSIQVGAASLEKSRGGSGVLLSGVPGVSPGRVTILGGGVVGSNAALIAIGLGADVTVIDRSLDRLRLLHGQFGNRLRTLHLTEEAIETSVAKSDLIIGAILVPGATTPRAAAPRTIGQNAARLGTRRCLDRPGRLLRDQPSDHPRRPDLRRRWNRALLRRQHARCGRPDLDLRPQQRDLAVHPRTGRQGVAARLAG